MAFKIPVYYAVHIQPILLQVFGLTSRVRCRSIYENYTVSVEPDEDGIVGSVHGALQQGMLSKNTIAIY